MSIDQKIKEAKKAYRESQQGSASTFNKRKIYNGDRKNKQTRKSNQNNNF